MYRNASHFSFQVLHTCGPPYFQLLTLRDRKGLVHFSPCPLELTHFWNNLRKLIDGLRCIDNFTSRCLDAQHREFFHMLYAGTKQVIVDLCEDEDYQKGRYKSPLLRIPSD